MKWGTNDGFFKMRQTKIREEEYRKRRKGGERDKEGGERRNEKRKMRKEEKSDGDERQVEIEVRKRGERLK